MLGSCFAHSRMGPKMCLQVITVQTILKHREWAFVVPQHDNPSLVLLASHIGAGPRSSCSTHVQLPAYRLRKQWGMAHVRGPLHPHGAPGRCKARTSASRLPVLPLPPPFFFVTANLLIYVWSPLFKFPTCRSIAF